MAGSQAPEDGGQSRRLLFVGNSHTYQPKELGGLPGAVARLASSASGLALEVSSVTRGGALLDELWEEFKATLQRGLDGPGWDTFVLQVGLAPDLEAQLATIRILEQCYAPLLLELQPNCRILLYQTWSGPRPPPGEAGRLEEGAEAYRAALLAAGLRDVRVAPVGHAFLALLAAPGVDRQIYPALWKDDSGHASALAGALAAAVVALALGLLGPGGEGSRRRPLGRVLEAMLPGAWRTASPGFAGEADFGQRLWGKAQTARGAPGEVMEILANTEEDLPLSRYPPGLRTEKRDLGPAFGDALAAAALEATGHSSSAMSPEVSGALGRAEEPSSRCLPAPTVDEAASGAEAAAAAAPAERPQAKPRRWNRK